MLRSRTGRSFSASELSRGEMAKKVIRENPKHFLIL